MFHLHSYRAGKTLRAAPSRLAAANLFPRIVRLRSSVVSNPMTVYRDTSSQVFSGLSSR
jgi:hypothetical protein